MSLSTHSKFFFGHTVDGDNNAIDFNEGGPEIQATLETGEYTLTTFAAEVARAMTEAGALTYTVAIDRATGKLTISSTSTFALLVATGTRAGTTAYTLMGFTGANRTGASSYEGNNSSGSTYTTQFILQDYVSSDHKKATIDPTLNKSASGRIELFGFGQETFYEMNFRFVTDRDFGTGAPIRTNLSGVADLVELLDYLITKAPIEFMPNEDAPNTFASVLLESTPADSKGSGYELKELYDRGMPGFFETGVLTLRVVET